MMKPLRILLAEDCGSLRHASAEVLRLAGYEVVEARDGTGGLDKLDASIDVIITDNNIPYVGGPVLIQMAKRANPKLFAILIGVETSEINIIALARQCGADECFKKPVNWEEVLEKLHLLAEQKGEQRGNATIAWNKQK